MPPSEQPWITRAATTYVVLSSTLVCTDLLVVYEREFAALSWRAFSMMAVTSSLEILGGTGGVCDFARE
ncbi:hypothetical protein [Ferrimicrobium sp.]|uniref:hypothetical protein n=1 Tax=Ferrimicrobium sp. TaxID=2926050 RepID=UPI00261F54FA|nr:hypothetical protein [Ferrimicrobium sp.]